MNELIREIGYKTTIKYFYNFVHIAGGTKLILKIYDINKKNYSKLEIRKKDTLVPC